MGYSSWNDCGSVVTEAHIKDIAKFVSFISFLFLAWQRAAAQPSMDGLVVELVPVQLQHRAPEGLPS